MGIFEEYCRRCVNLTGGKECFECEVRPDIKDPTRFIEGKQIPIKPMPTIEPLNKYQLIGESIGKLVDEKNKAYGDSFNKSADFLKILYPNGAQPNQYGDMLAIIRIFDKLMRIATDKEALGENPFRDICGYSILKSEE